MSFSAVDCSCFFLVEKEHDFNSCKAVDGIKEQVTVIGFDIGQVAYKIIIYIVIKSVCRIDEFLYLFSINCNIPDESGNQ